MSPKKGRTTDSLRSKFLHIENRDRLIQLAKGEAIRIFGGKDGDYHLQQGCRRYPYCSNSCINLGGEGSKAIPRIYYSKNIGEKQEKKIREELDFGEYEVGTKERQDYIFLHNYEYRIQLQMGTDKENQVIHTMTPEMEEMIDIAWKAMLADDDLAHLCRDAKKRPNNCSVQLYTSGDDIKQHRDNEEDSRNVMEENTPVIVVTVGDTRHLQFSHEYDMEKYKGKRDAKFKSAGRVQESQHSHIFAQKHGSTFVLHPLDEKKKVRKVASGFKHSGALFQHGVESERGKNFCSIAFVFRTLVDSAVVPVVRTSQKVIPKLPKTEREAFHRKNWNKQRMIDEKQGSVFKKKVKKIRLNWRRLFAFKGWIGPDE